VKFEITPGDHYTMLQQPNVAAIAKTLRDCFNVHLLEKQEFASKKVAALGKHFG